MWFKDVLFPDGSRMFDENTSQDELYCKEEFIKFYKQVYYWKNNIFVERRIIDLLNKDDEFSDDDCFLILAWKCGGINHLKSEDNNIIYNFGWDQPSKTRKLKGKIINYSGLCNIINAFRKEVKQGGNIKVLYSQQLDIFKNLEKRIGPTYATTLMYFASKGKMPIYDQFAGRAMDAICNKPLKNDYVLTYDGGQRYFTFFEDITREFKDEYINRNKNRNMEKWREVDQALWAYGHVLCLRF